MKKKSILLILLLIIIDQLSKIFVVSKIDLYSSVNVIPNFFKLTYNKNFGAAFGILEGKRFFFIIISVLVLGYLIYEIIKSKDSKLYIYSLVLIISGIFGNFIDRLFYGYVRDFLDFKIFNYDFPIFNLADSFIVIGVILFIINIFMEERNGSKRELDRK